MIELPENGLLGIDWGEKKIGLALCDESGLSVRPLKTIQRSKNAKKWKVCEHDRQELNKIMGQWQPGALVLGLPLAEDGSDTGASKKMRRLGNDLSSEFGRKVYFSDERLSSWEAGAGPDDDAKAAAVFLERFLLEKKQKAPMDDKGGFVKLFLLMCLLAFGVGAYFYHAFAMTPHRAGEQNYTIDVSPGSGFPTLFRELGISGANLTMAKAWLKLRSLEQSLKVGEFEVDPKWSYAEALEQVLTKAPIYHSYTVREGENLWDIQKSLSEIFPDLSQEDFQAIVTDQSLLDFANVPQHKNRSLEGYLFPETYSYQKYHTPRQIVRNMLEEFERRARPILSKHPWAESNEGFYKLLTLASIVEKESSDVEEQPLVASVFWNRIEKGMRLQSDPTIIYPLLPDFDGNIRRIHIRMKNDYNTYTMSGLPIGPIANPGASALEAVINPAESDYFYFVSKNDGTHVFSKDYKTHSKWVREYQILRKQSASN